ncbi:hypothetical protein V6N12_074861 [Hibiscus sabdariffa]|uniref:DUF4283 domain-containing protein n=1 Tax=Hibiscus sabdariffa TaxID=183260 RepID=A0ABR2D3G3_9ROSI
MYIENDYFLVTFCSHSNFLHVLTNGPWLVFGHYLTIEPWMVDFSSAKPYPSKVMAWICLPSSSITLYKSSLISEIGECIGKLIEYESLPTICYECGRHGHSRENYPTLALVSDVPSNTVQGQRHEPSPPPSNLYDRWMVGQDGSNDPAHDQAAHPNSLPTPSVEPTPQLSKVVAKGKNVISLKTKVSRPRAATTINNAFVTIGRHFVLQAGSSKQQFQACTPHAIVHLDRNKHSIVVAIYCPDSEQPVLTTVPSTSPLDPTEPPDNHSVPFIAISCD